MPSNTLTDDAREQRTIRLLRRARSARPADEARCRAEAVQLNMPIARSLATRYAGRGISLDDLTQVAYLGLVQAAIRFDPTRASRFTDFAVPTIRGELRKHFRDAGWTVRPPRRLQELQARIWAAEDDLVHELHRSPKPTELAGHIGADVDDVVEALAIDGCFAPSSLDTPPTPDARPAIESLTGDIGELSAAEARQVLAPAIRRLKPRDRQILELRYFKDLTQQEIGDILGVTQMQVSRLISRILRDLRAAVDEDGPRARVVEPCEGRPMKHGRVSIPERELSWRFSRSSGPGGQHVNTTDTRVELSWNLAETTVLTEAQKDLVATRLRGRLVDGTLTIVSSEYRSQHRNREAARVRLEELVTASAVPVKKRNATKPSKASQRRRLEAKRARSDIKQTRKRVTE